jgi:hypothetical protein
MRPEVIRLTGVHGFGEPPAATKAAPGLPPFKFDCDPSCFPPPFSPSTCASLQTALGKRIVGAANLARNAASKLETRPKDVEKIFREVFGQGPRDFWELPCCPRQKEHAGKIVAGRFRTVEKELRTRSTLYRCASDAVCAQAVSRSREEGQRHPTDLVAYDLSALAFLCRDEVWLCSKFWRQKEEWQIGTILHEMFHLCFGVTCAWFQHDQKEKARNSAYCYEVFALKAAGKVPDQVSIDKCKDVLSRNGS